MTRRLLEQWFRKALRLPSEPALPRYDAKDSVRVYSPPKRYYWYQLCRTQAGALFGIAFGVWAFGWIPEVGRNILEEVPTLAAKWYIFGWIEWIEIIGVIGFLFQLVVTSVVLGLDLRYRWYVVTDQSLRVCSGLWNFEERTMSLTNLQTLSIRQGPLQQLFRIADLRVESAGGGGSDSNDHSSRPSQGLHISTFRGVGEAESIRELIRSYLAELHREDRPPTQAKHGEAEPGGLRDAVLEARAVLTEAAALARTVKAHSATQKAPPHEASSAEEPNRRVKNIVTARAATNKSVPLKRA